MDAAEDVTVEIFEREDGSLEDIQGESEAYEDELRERSDTSQSDVSRISEAGGRIETQEPASELAEAKAHVQEDIDFLDDEMEQENRAREETDRERQRHEGRVHGGGR